MCGIFCIFIKGFNAKVNYKEIAERSVVILDHRGPNENGIESYCEEKITLCHTRLSIVDLKFGRQPLSTLDNRIHVIVNGEVYNHKNLIGGVDPKLYENIPSKSDSMSVLYAYQSCGRNPLETVLKLDGMFSFVLIDETDPKNPILFAVRDPLGIEPLYMATNEEAIVFSSELKALGSDIYDKIEVFPAGHYFVSNSKSQVPQRYYKPNWSAIASKMLISRNNFEGSHETVIKTVRQLLAESVRKRLMSDVELGTFLSGGLDSSIISALVQKLRKDKSKPLHTFSVGYASDNTNSSSQMDSSTDLYFAKMAASYLGTKHHVVEFTFGDVIKNIPKIIYSLESYDVSLIYSAIPNYFLSEEASKHVTVILTGEGADELFCGYKFFRGGNDNENLQKSIEQTLDLGEINLLRCDRMTMAHSLEARVPFLDVDFMRYIFEKIPPKFKSHFFQGDRSSSDHEKDLEKYILRKAFEGYLPKEVLWRRKDMFSEGVGESWVKKLQEYCEKEISDSEYSRRGELFRIPEVDIPQNKTEFYFRKIFEEVFRRNQFSGLYKNLEKVVFRWSRGEKVVGVEYDHEI